MTLDVSENNTTHINGDYVSRYIKLKYMKQLFQTILFAAAVMAACSCEELQKDGAWDPVELDKSNIEFPAEGGQETVTALNYTSWWINGLYDIRSHRQSRRSVSERTQPSIPTAQARLQGLQACPQTLAEPRCKSLFGCLLIAHEVWRLKPA